MSLPSSKLKSLYVLCSEKAAPTKQDTMLFSIQQPNEHFPASHMFCNFVHMMQCTFRAMGRASTTYHTDIPLFLGVQGITTLQPK
jgi:hypothetical protein